MQGSKFYAQLFKSTLGKKAKSHLTTLVTVAALSLPMSQAFARELKGWSIHPDTYPVNMGMQHFADAVPNITNNKDTAKVYPSSQLGAQNTVMDKLASGEIDFAEIGVVGGYGDKVPALRVLGIPYMFYDSAQMLRLLDGRLGEILAGELDKAGVVLLGWYDGGTRNFYHTKKPLRSLSDFENQRLRAGNSKIPLAMVNATGAKAVPLEFKDVYKGFEDGKIDGAENNLMSYESTGHYKVAPHYTFTQHMVAAEMLIMSKKTWATFTPAEQASLLRAGRDSAVYMRQEWNRREKETQARLTKLGVKFYTGVNYAPFVLRMKEIYSPLWTDKDPTSVQVLHIILNNMTGVASSQ